MMDEDSKQCTTFTVGNLGFFECEDALWAVQCASYFPKINAKLPGRTQPYL